MARVKDNYVMEGISGAIGKELVFRKFKSGTFTGKFPNKSTVTPSKNQTKGRNRFAEGVAFARAVKSDPAKAARYKEKNVDSVYHAALKDYLDSDDPDKLVISFLPAVLAGKIKDLSLNEEQLRAIVWLSDNKKLTNGIYRKINSVSKATATRHLQDMLAMKLIESNGGIGAGAHYIMGS